MSYYIVYAAEGKDPEDGDALGTGLGWLNWGDYVLDRHERYPECAHLAQEGWLPAADLDAAEHECEQLTHAEDPNVAAVSANLLAAVRGRPGGCVGVLVTDGTEPGEEGEDNEGDE